MFKYLEKLAAYPYTTFLTYSYSFIHAYFYITLD